ncbi:MAG: DMT family transporter [Candidatus Nanopelagicaceae bacterium]|jgi:drug/metabolite transporter (DMT)-like permease
MSRKGWILFTLVGLLWGVPYLFMKVAVEELSTPMIVFTRLMIGAALLVPLALREGSLKSALKYWRYILLYAVLEMVIPWSLITSSQRDLSSGVVALLVATVPIWATLFAHQTGDSTAAHRVRIFGIIIGLIGITLIVGIESISDFGNIRALLQILVAAASYAWAVNMITRKAPGISGIAINGIAMMISSVIFAPFAIANRPETLPSLEVTLSMLGLGVLCSGIAFWVFFVVLDEIGPARASLVVYPNTAVAVVLGIVILREPITLAILIGLPLVLVGSYFASRKPNSQPIAA